MYKKTARTLDYLARSNRFSDRIVRGGNKLPQEAGPSFDELADKIREAVELSLPRKNYTMSAQVRRLVRREHKKEREARRKVRVAKKAEKRRLDIAAGRKKAPIGRIALGLTC